MEPPKKKRKVLSLEEKAKAISAVASGRKKCDVAAEHGIPASTLSTILKGKDAILRAASSGKATKKKNLKTTPYEKLEEALYTWFMDMRAKNVPISGEVLQRKALCFACLLGFDDFKASSGWLTRFKGRYAVVGKVICGEENSVNRLEAGDWLSENVPDILTSYAPRDIYNADESGLFYQMLPKRTLAQKGASCHGGKQSKQRVTMLLYVNMDGTDKRKVLIIGKSVNPRCFKGCRELDMQYEANGKAWMTRVIFGKWLKEFDVDMCSQKRKVCLLLDNCTAHYVPQLELTNVELRYFPPNATSVIQPLDQGIINSVKSAYKCRVIDKLLLNLEHNRATKIDIYTAIALVAASWKATRTSVIVNCFRHAGFKTSDPEDLSSLELPNQEATPSSWEALRQLGHVSEDSSFGDYLRDDADADIQTTEVLDDSEILRLVATGQKDDAEADDAEAVEDPVPTPSQVMDAVDLLRRFAGAHEGTAAAFNALTAYEKCVLPLLTKRSQSKITSFFLQQ
ncbi:tigger transposable element-derived protein 6-like [Ixodes scapularis]|uniref:tigger transposable element-derived protein 6-like n=1 Tax=Ixodes scapularis TaxID=6945 RepID=UPI001AD71B2F|nr:tigger transposable element-derived protein 6-like [Ixodes scapularis]